YGSSTIPLQGLDVWSFKDPHQAVAAQLKILENVDKGAAFQSAFLKSKPVVKTSARQFQGFDLHQAQVEWDLDKLAGSNPAVPDDIKKALKDAFTKMLGEGFTVWFGTDGKSYLQVVAKDWAAAEKILQRYFKDEAVGAEANFQAARKEMPAESTLLEIF